MSIKNVLNAKDIIYRIRNAYSMPTDTKLADFLGVDPSTISSWKRRDTIDYPLIFTKCTDLSADYLIYGKSPMFKDKNDPRNIKKPDSSSNIKKPSETWPDDPVLTEFERRVDEIVNTLDRAPFSQALKVRIIESLLGMVGEELDELQKQSDPTQPVDD